MSPERRVIGLVTASPLLRNQFLEFVDEAIGCQPTMSVRNDGTLYQVSLTANAAALASLLYDGSTFALPRWSHPTAEGMVRGAEAALRQGPPVG